MKKLLIALVFFAGTFPAASAQILALDSIRLYRVGDYFIKDNAGGYRPELLAPSDVHVKKNGKYIQVDIGRSAYKYVPKSFLNRSGVAYDTTNSYLAIKAFKDALPGTTGVTSTSIADITSGTVTVSTTGCFEINVENTGASSSTVTYGGFTYTLAAGASRTFDRKRDPKSGRYTPFLTLVAIPGSGSIRVTKYQEQ